MLRRLLWVGVITLFAASLYAPTASAQGIKLGVKGGVNIADVGGSDVSVLGTTETKAGLIAGAFAEFMIGNMFAIQPEVLYSQKGTKVTEQGVEGKFKLDYVEVPLLLKVNIPIEGSKVHPHVYAGPAVALKASCKIEASGGGASASVDCEDAGAEITSTDFGVAFGGGVSVDVGGAEVGIDVRYTLGLRTVDDFDDPDDIKNKVISIMGTVGFATNR
jgi:hypothetical protein